MSFNPSPPYGSAAASGGDPCPTCGGRMEDQNAVCCDDCVMAYLERVQRHRVAINARWPSLPRDLERRLAEAIPNDQPFRWLLGASDRELLEGWGVGPVAVRRFREAQAQHPPTGWDEHAAMVCLTDHPWRGG